MACARDVKSLSTTIEEMGNPFCERSTDLLVLDSRNIIDSFVADTVLQIEKLSLDLYGVSDLLPKLCQSLIPSKGITFIYSADLQSQESPVNNYSSHP